MFRLGRPQAIIPLVKMAVIKVKEEAFNAAGEETCWGFA